VVAVGGGKRDGLDAGKADRRWHAAVARGGL
jgi:hypothetical protein